MFYHAFVGEFKLFEGSKKLVSLAVCEANSVKSARELLASQGVDIDHKAALRLTYVVADDALRGNLAERLAPPGCVSSPGGHHRAQARLQQPRAGRGRDGGHAQPGGGLDGTGIDPAAVDHWDALVDRLLAAGGPSANAWGIHAPRCGNGPSPRWARG